MTRRTPQQVAQSLLDQHENDNGERARIPAALDDGELLAWMVEAIEADRNQCPMLERLPAAIEEAASSVIVTWYRATVIEDMHIRYTNLPDAVIPVGTIGWALNNQGHQRFVADDPAVHPRSVQAYHTALSLDLEDWRQASYRLPESIGGLTKPKEAPVPKPMSAADLAAIHSLREVLQAYGDDPTGAVRDDDEWALAGRFREADAAIGTLMAEVDRLHSWAGLMSILDEHYPESIFPTESDRGDRDSGPRIISLIREVDRLRAKETENEWEYDYEIRDPDGRVLGTPVSRRNYVPSEYGFPTALWRKRRSGKWEPVVAGDPDE